MSAPAYLSGKKAVIETIQRPNSEFQHMIEAMEMDIREAASTRDAKDLHGFANRMSRLADELD